MQCDADINFICEVWILLICLNLPQAEASMAVDA